VSTSTAHVAYANTHRLLPRDVMLVNIARGYVWHEFYLARTACMSRGLYGLLALTSFFLKINIWAKWSQHLLDRFSPSFHHMVGIWSPFFDGSRDIAIANNYTVKIGKIGLFTFIRSPGILKRIEYHNSDFKSLSSMIWLGLHCL